MTRTALRLVALAVVTATVACAHQRSRASSQSASERSGGVLDAGAEPLPPAPAPLIDLDAGAPLPRELAPRVDIVSDSLQQHDNPRALVLARCQQQQRCGFVGRRGKYELPQQCMVVLLDEQRDRLLKYSCPESTDQRALENCLQALTGLDCAQPFAGFDTLPECQPTRICRGSNDALRQTPPSGT